MKMWVHTPDWLMKLLPRIVWKVNTQRKEIYLTFDDGPTPGITPRVLDFLFDAGCKATFFCLGENIQTYPNLAQRIVSDGHKLANHGFRHQNGWCNSSRQFVDNMHKGSEMSHSNLFRPPYGKLWPWQFYRINKSGSKVILWSTMSMDFDFTIPPSACLNHCIQKLKPGSIIVFHDTLKAAPNLLTILPEFLNYLSRQGFSCAILPDDY